jgi:hypothetical protein
MCWRFQKELLKSVGQLRKVLAFTEGAVKKVLASIEMCWQLKKVLAFTEGAVKKCCQA